MEEDDETESFLTQKDEVNGIGLLPALPNEMNVDSDFLHSLTFETDLANAGNMAAAVPPNSLNLADEVVEFPADPSPEQTLVERALLSSADPHWWTPADANNVSGSKRNVDVVAAPSQQDCGGLVNLAPNSENFVRITNNQIVHAGRQPPPGVQDYVPPGQLDDNMDFPWDAMMSSMEVSLDTLPAPVMAAYPPPVSLSDTPTTTAATSSSKGMNGTASSVSLGGAASHTPQQLPASSSMKPMKLVSIVRSTTTAPRAQGPRPRDKVPQPRTQAAGPRPTDMIPQPRMQAAGPRPRGMVPQPRMQAAGQRPRTTAASPQGRKLSASRRKPAATATVSSVTKSEALKTTEAPTLPQTTAGLQVATLVAVNATTASATRQAEVACYTSLKSMSTPLTAALVRRKHGDLVIQKAVLKERPITVLDVPRLETGKAESISGDSLASSASADSSTPSSPMPSETPSTSVAKSEGHAMCIASVSLLEMLIVSQTIPRAKAILDYVFQGDPEEASYFIATAEEAQRTLPAIAGKSITETKPHSSCSSSGDRGQSSFSVLAGHLTDYEDSHSEHSARDAPTRVVQLTCDDPAKAKVLSVPYGEQSDLTGTTSSTTRPVSGDGGTGSLQSPSLPATTTTTTITPATAGASGCGGLQTRTVSSRGRPITLSAKSLQLAQNAAGKPAQSTARRKTTSTPVTPYTSAPVPAPLAQNSDGSVTMGNSHGDAQLLHCTRNSGTVPGPSCSSYVAQEEEIHSAASYEVSSHDFTEEQQLVRSSYTPEFDYSQPMACPDDVLETEQATEPLQPGTLSADAGGQVVSAWSVQQQQATPSESVTPGVAVSLSDLTPGTYLTLTPLHSTVDGTPTSYAILAPVFQPVHTVPARSAETSLPSSSRPPLVSSAATSQQQVYNIVVDVAPDPASNVEEDDGRSASSPRRGTKRRKRD